MDKFNNIKNLNLLLKNSILQYKFAVGIRNYFVLNEDHDKITSFPEIWTYQKHTVNNKDLNISINEENKASILFEHSSLYLMANQLDSILEIKFNDRFNHADNSIKNLSIITRVIRNAFAHNPFNPKWLFRKKFKNKLFKIENIIELNTNELENKPVKRKDYGGPLSILLMANFALDIIESN